MKSFSFAFKQNVTYFFILALSAVAAIIGYRLTHEDWIIFNEAEKNYANKNYEAAIELYEKSLEMGIPISAVGMQLANSYVVLGKFKDAIPIYRRYLQEHPKDTHTRLEFAKTLNWAGLPQEAEEEIQKIQIEGANP